MTLEEIAIPGVETAGPSTTVEVLALSMAENGVGSIVVVEDEKPIGIVTDRDLALLLGGEHDDPRTLTAAEVMTPDPLAMPASAGVAELTTVMRQESVRRMPVVDDDGKLVGIVTFDDLVRLLATELDDLGAVVKAESPG